MRSVTALSTPPLIATATRAGIRCGSHCRRERIRQCVDRQRLPADRARLEQRQAAQVGVDARSVCVDDPAVSHAQPNGGPVGAACGIAVQLLHRARVLAESRGGSRGSPHHAPTRRSCRVHVNLDKPGGCRANRRHQMPRPDPGSLSHGVGSTCTRLYERGRALVSDPSGDHPARAYDQWICWTPCRPSRRASASVRSNWRPGSYGPRSTTCVSTVVPWKVMKIRAPQGSVGCATPFGVGLEDAAARRGAPERGGAARAGERDERAHGLRARSCARRASEPSLRAKRRPRARHAGERDLAHREIRPHPSRLTRYSCRFARPGSARGPSGTSRDVDSLRCIVPPRPNRRRGGGSPSGSRL